MIQAVKFMLMAEDMERARNFYRDALGLEVKSANPYWSELCHGDSIVALHAGGRGEYTETGLSFTVDDIGAACEAVVARGGKLRSGPVERPGEPIKLAELTDTEGNGFMLSEDITT